MATVRLGRYEIERGRMPKVCMACGAPATVRKSKKFAWHPPWVYALLLAGLLPALIVAAILTKRMTLTAPFCDRHKRYFFLRNDVLVISLILLLVLGCAGFYGSFVVQERPNSDLGFLYALAFGLTFLCWLIVAAVLGHRSIRPSEITDRSITLVNVSEEYARALHLSRMGPLPEDYLDVLPADLRGPAGSEQYYGPKGN